MTEPKPKIYTSDTQAQHEIGLFKVLAVKHNGDNARLTWSEIQVFQSLYNQVGKEKAESLLREIKDFPHNWQPAANQTGKATINNTKPIAERFFALKNGEKREITKEEFEALQIS